MATNCNSTDNVQRDSLWGPSKWNIQNKSNEGKDCKDVLMTIELSSAMPNGSDSLLNSLNTSKSYSTPMGINKKIILALYVLYIFFCGSTYWGWNGFQEMFYKSGLYSNECSNEESNSYLVVGNSKYVDCLGRQQKINNLYTVAFACHFATSAIGGAVLDAFGPKKSALIGLVFGLISWNLFAFSRNGMLFLNYVAAAFLGISADFSYFPVLSLANIYQGNESFVMAVMGSARSCSFAIPVILSSIYTNSFDYSGEDFWKFCIGYVVIGLGYCFAVAIFFIPNKPYKLYEKTDDNITPNKNGPTGIFESSEKSISTETIDKPNSDSFVKWLLNKQYLLVLPYFCIMLIRAEFFAKSNKNQMVTTDGRNIYQMFSIMNIMSFLPGLLMGKICDAVGVLPVMLLLNICGIAMYGFLTPDILFMKGMSVMLYFVYCSFILSHLYVYIRDVFPLEHFGKLTGIASLIAGLFSLTSILWYRLATEHLAYLYPYNYAPMNAFMIGLGIANNLLWYHMYRMAKASRKLKEFSLSNLLSICGKRNVSRL